VANVDCITLFVEDLAAAQAFYRDVFGLPVAYEDSTSSVHAFGNLSINLLSLEGAAELIEPAAVARADAGARFQFTISVEDLDAEVARVTALGVTLLNGPMDRPWGIRTASFQDPGGHIWEFAQDLP